MRALGAEAEEYLPGLLGNLANVLASRRSLDEATDLAREALAIEARLNQEPSPRIAAAQNMLALSLKLAGRLDEAQELYEKANAQWRVLYPEGSEQLALGLSNLGTLYSQRSDFRRGEELMRESLAIARRVFPADHPQIEVLLDILCLHLCKRHQFRDAAPLLDELMPMRVRLHGDDAPNLAGAAEFAAMGLRGEYPDEKPLEIARRLVAKIWPGVAETDKHLVFALRAAANAATTFGETAFAEEARRVGIEIRDRANAPDADQR
jgi:tetratricopeptide (TPR) repeat protein